MSKSLIHIASLILIVLGAYYAWQKWVRKAI